VGEFRELDFLGKLEKANLVSLEGSDVEAGIETRQSVSENYQGR
jgi:hypothetical protein